jgi:hypothetical protein
MLKEACHQNEALFSEIPGAAKLFTELCLTPDWFVAIATSAWYESASLKLQIANINIEGIPLASANDAIAREDIIKAAIDLQSVLLR